MGLETEHFKTLMAVKRELNGRKINPVKVLCLGYPDMVVSRAAIPVDPLVNLPAAKDSADIAKWHGWNGPVYDTNFIFKYFGIEADYIDINASRGIERVVDLNEEAPEDLTNKYDIVLDPGTLEHCFNIAMAFSNVISFLKRGGFVIHVNPLNLPNHGFWSLNPTAYFDFYSNNGFKVHESVLLVGPLDNRMVVKGFKPTERFSVNMEASNMVIAEKIIDKDDLVCPMQTKYTQNPGLKLNSQPESSPMLLSPGTSSSTQTSAPTSSPPDTSAEK